MEHLTNFFPPVIYSYSEDCPIELLSPLDALCEFVLHASALEIQRIYRGYRSRHPSSSCENPGLPEKRVGDPSKYVDAEILPIDDLVGRVTTDSLRESTSALWDAHMNFAPQHMLRRVCFVFFFSVFCSSWILFHSSIFSMMIVHLSLFSSCVILIVLFLSFSDILYAVIQLFCREKV